MKKKKKLFQQGMSFVLALAMVFSLFQGSGLSLGASAASTGDYTGAGAASYTATARVDESVGLRATVSVTGGAGSVQGIKPKDTRTTGTLNVSGDNSLTIQAAPFQNYTVQDVVVSAIAEFKHSDGTIDAVKDVKKITDTGALAAGYSYPVPDFSEYVESGDEVSLEITVYGDFTYAVPAVDYVINVSTGAVTTGSGAGASLPRGSGRAANTFLLDTAAYGDKTFKITGTSVADLGPVYQIYAYNSAKDDNRRINLIYEDANFLPVTGATMSNYKSWVNSTSPNAYATYVTANASSTNSLRVSNGTKQSNSPLTLADVDAYVTVQGSNVLAITSSYEDGGGASQAGVFVDASASMIVTDASTGDMYVRGGGCSAGIGSAGTTPAGYVEIDGGKIEAFSAINSHSFAGIGNGGHYSSDDPGIRGIVVNGGEVKSFGYHYGIGGNGGRSSDLSPTVGKVYVVLAGGKVVSEASAGSMGASLGFAYQNNTNLVRIGRPDKGDTDNSLTSVNWGFGAAVSGKMTFYSGETKAYSGEYAAAIGGCAISDASTSIPSINPGSSLNTAIRGTDMTVYGGKFTAVSGAFSQEAYISYDVTRVRGNSGTRTGPESIDSSASWGTKGYGAAIGGAVGKDGGSANKIFAGNFQVYSSFLGAGIGGGGYNNYPGSFGNGGNTVVGTMVDSGTGAEQNSQFDIITSTYGAGIGGGGGSVNNAGSGGDLYISGGNFNVSPRVAIGDSFGAGIGGGGSMANIAGSGGNITITGGEFQCNSGNYGAGIGGGGSQNGTAGNFGNAMITGGQFQSNAGGYGAGIGGGGTLGGTGGTCGRVEFQGGTVQVSSANGVGIGGGAANGGTDNTKIGTVIVTGGNIFTEINAQIDPTGTVLNTNQHAHVLPNPVTTSPFGSTTETATKIQLPLGADTVGDSVRQVAYSYGGNWRFDYGVNDTFVTPSTEAGKGEVWVWVPSNYKLEYDLNGGGTKDGYLASHSMQTAYGFLYAVMERTANIYNSSGETKALVQWNDPIDANSYGGLYSPHVPGGSGGGYADGRQYLKLLTHPNDNGKTVLFAGWSKDPDSHIYARGESARPTFIDEVEFENRDLKVYAVWAYDENNNGIPDIVEDQNRLVYDANGGDAASVPVNSMRYLEGAMAPIANRLPTWNGSTHILMGWTDTQEAVLKGGDIMPSTIYGIDTAAGQINQISVPMGGVRLYALWAEDRNGNGVPDVNEPTYQVNYDLNGGAGTLGTTASVEGVTVTLEPGTGLTYGSSLFLGWTLDSAASGAVYGKGDAALLPALVNEVTFETSNITVYAVWSADTNGNGIPDVYETGYRLRYNSGTADTVQNVPEDTNEYFANEQVTVLDSGAGMARSGWTFLGWTLNASQAGDKTSDPTGTVTYAAPPLTFVDADITLYGVWGIDANNNGNPDWNESGSLVVQYSPTLSTVDLSTMPYPVGPNTFIDNNGGQGYLNGTPRPMPTQSPSAPNEIFLGWSPVYFEKFNFGSGDLGNFKSLLTFLRDVTEGENNSGRNRVGTTGTMFPQAVYGITELDSDLADCTSNTLTHPDYWPNYDWDSYQIGDGFLDSVTFPGFRNDMADFGADWQVYAIWAEDLNRNGIPDMFEASFTLYYDGNGGSNLPQNVTNLHPGDFVPLHSDPTNLPARLDDDNMDMIFMGWTADDTVRDFYEAGDRGELPILSNAVTFGSFDITVYAVWGMDSDHNGIPDVTEDGFSLTYDANGGTGEPVDTAAYQNGNTVTLNTATVPTHPEGNVFLYWTLDGSVQGEVFTTGQAGILPVQTQNVTFRYSDITVYAVWSTDRNGNGQPDVNETAYTLSFNLNGGSGASGDFGSAAYFPDESVTIPTTAPTPPNSSMIFQGWKDGSGNDYAAGDTLAMPASNLTLVAQYVPAPYPEVLNAANFTYDIASGTLTADRTKSLAHVSGTNSAGGSFAMSDITVNAGQLTAINTAISNGQVGTFPLTFTTPGGTAASVTVTLKKNTGGGGGGGGGSSETEMFTLAYETNGGREIPSEKYSQGTVVELSRMPIRESYSFVGWYSDKELTKAVTKVTMSSDLKVYAKWKMTPVPGDLNGDDHIAYVSGYPDGTVRPGANITRAEVAAIFYRLLKEDVRNENKTDTNSFVDVKKGSWYNTAVSTLTKMGIIAGRDKTHFAGDATITRAEFATIAAKFDQRNYPGEDLFTDITNHWAANNINTSATNGWISGYSDRSFRPNNSITRAEVITMVNRVLVRRPQSPSDLLPTMKTWPDNKDTKKWFYLDIQEATNGHDYNRKNDGVFESWTKLK